LRKLEVILTNEDFRKYPFLPEAISKLKELNLTIEDIASEDIGKEILELVKNNLVSSIRSGEVNPPHKDAELEILSFLATLLVLRIIGERGLTERFAVAFSKRTQNFLKNEELSKLIYIAQFIMRCRIKRENNLILIDIASFLNNMPEYKGIWKLINREVSKGWVKVSNRELARLVESGIKRYIITKTSEKLTELNIPDLIYMLVEEVSREWSKKLREYEEIRASIVRGGEEYYPPCIHYLLTQLREGKNLPHSARFALATFLLNIGISVEETLEIFKLSPDFRDDLARYQIEHIAGLRGSKTKYLTYKCDNMRSLGLCKWSCEGIRHPLQFYYRSLRGRKPNVSETS